MREAERRVLSMLPASLRAGPRSDFYWAAQPPSTSHDAPLTNFAAGDARKTTAAAISSVSPIRPRGVLSSSDRSYSGEAANCPAFIGVRILPGATQLTRTPWGPSSVAKARVINSTAPFVAQ